MGTDTLIGASASTSVAPTSTAAFARKTRQNRGSARKRPDAVTWEALAPAPPARRIARRERGVAGLVDAVICGHGDGARCGRRVLARWRRRSKVARPGC